MSIDVLQTSSIPVTRRQKHQPRPDSAALRGTLSIHGARAPEMSLAVELSLEPELGEPPITLDGFRRHTQNRCRLFHAQASEKPQLDDTGLPNIDSRECLQRAIQRQ